MVSMNLGKAILMSTFDQSDDEDLRRRVATLDFDELMLLRSIHAKLDPTRTAHLDPSSRRYGGLVW
jgi:hypothetical protein